MTIKIDLQVITSGLQIKKIVDHVNIFNVGIVNANNNSLKTFFNLARTNLDSI